MDIEERVKQAISKQLEKDVNNIQDDSLLADDLGMDSFGAVELAFGIEEEFNIKVPQDELINIKQVRDVINYIKNKKGEEKS